MAKLKRLIVSRRDSIKIGDFESITPSWSEEWELEDGDDPQEIRKKVVTTVDKMYYKVAQRHLRDAVKRRINDRDEEAQDYMDEACDYFNVSQAKKTK